MNDFFLKPLCQILTTMYKMDSNISISVDI